jgi:hypothetical protein
MHLFEVSELSRAFMDLSSILYCDLAFHTYTHVMRVNKSDHVVLISWGYIVR